jgi:hypothetical protein
MMMQPKGLSSGNGASCGVEFAKAKRVLWVCPSKLQLLPWLKPNALSKLPSGLPDPTPALCCQNRIKKRCLGSSRPTEVNVGTNTDLTNNDHCMTSKRAAAGSPSSRRQSFSEGFRRKFSFRAKAPPRRKFSDTNGRPNAPEGRSQQADHGFGEPPIKEGYLWRKWKTGVRRKWEHGYFVLRGSFLYAYDSASAADTSAWKSVIALKDARISVCSHRTRQDCLEIEHEDRRSCIFDAEFRASKLEW